MGDLNNQDESRALLRVAEDYIFGWYDGDAERMESALHADLVKRIAIKGPDGRVTLRHMGAMELVRNTRAGNGKKDAERIANFKILDRFENAAILRIEATRWIDYLNLAKFEGEWKIVNVLWELKP